MPPRAMWGGVAQHAQNRVLLCTRPADQVTLRNIKAPGCWIKYSVKVDHNQSEKLLAISQGIDSILLVTGWIMKKVDLLL